MMEGPWSYRVASFFMISPIYTLIVLTGMQLFDTPSAVPSLSFLRASYYNIIQCRNNHPTLTYSRNACRETSNIRKGGGKDVEAIFTELGM